MSPLIQQILNDPAAPALAGELQQALADEASRRQAFRQWTDESQKAEFINGEVVLHSPVKKQHLEVSRRLFGLMHFYTSLRGLGVVWAEKAMVSLTRNDYEPDLCFFPAEQAAAFTEDQMLFPAPAFVAEILSARTAKIDQGIKKQDYAAHGIGEYWIIDPVRQRVEQYLLALPSDRTYFPPYLHSISDLIESRTIPGFRIPVAAMFEEAANVAALQRILRGDPPAEPEAEYGA
ncbi:MAG: Uma2 family endonuclease [Bacteroidia bacterium]|nr:Uma2 family endonuclease [Bacteroidia bacterium]